MRVLVAGPEGGICDDAFHAVENAIAACDCGAGIERVTEFERIVALGVYAVPGIIVDGVLRSVGRVPDQDEMVRWLLWENC